MHRQIHHSDLVTARKGQCISDHMRDDHFRRYLEQSHVGTNGRPLSKRAAGDYVSRCRRIEAMLDCDLDAVDARPEELANRIESRTGDLALDGVRSLQTALRRYADFREAVGRA